MNLFPRKPQLAGNTLTNSLLFARIGWSDWPPRKWNRLILRNWELLSSAELWDSRLGADLSSPPCSSDNGTLPSIFRYWKRQWYNRVPVPDQKGLRYSPIKYSLREIRWTRIMKETNRNQYHWRIWPGQEKSSLGQGSKDYFVFPLHHIIATGISCDLEQLRDDNFCENK